MENQRPRYNPVEKDYYCNKCGEPWDSYGVRHGDMTEQEAKRFLNGEGCPSCHFGYVTREVNR